MSHDGRCPERKIHWFKRIFLLKTPWHDSKIFKVTDQGDYEYKVHKECIHCRRRYVIRAVETKEIREWVEQEEMVAKLKGEKKQSSELINVNGKKKKELSATEILDEIRRRRREAAS